MGLPWRIGWAALLLVGRPPSSVPAGLAARAAPPAVVEAPTQACRGRVVDERRFPVAGAAVEVVQLRRDGSRAIERTMTMADGTFTVALPFEPRREDEPLFALATARAAGRVGSMRLFADRDALARPLPIDLPLSITLDPPRSVRVAVHDADGPVAGAVAELADALSGLALVEGVTDATGVARWLVSPTPASNVFLIARARHATRGSATMEIGLPLADDLALQLQPFRSLQVAVVDFDQQRPIAGARVQLSRQWKRWNWQPDAWPATSVSLLTDAEGRIELRDLPSGVPLRITARADHCAAHWWVPSGSQCGVEGYQQTEQVLEPAAALVRLELMRLVPYRLRWRVRPGVAPTPPAGTRLELRSWLRDWRADGGRSIWPSSAIVGAGVVEAALEAGPSIQVDWERREGMPDLLAIAPDGTLACLPTDPAAGTEFVRAGSLAIELRRDDGSPCRETKVMLIPEESRDKADDVRRVTTMTGAEGTAHFAGLWPGRYVITSHIVHGVVEVTGGARTLTLQVPRPREVAFEITIDGERWLPGDLQWMVSFSGWRERIGARIEEPEHARLRCFFDRAAATHQDEARFGSSEHRSRVVPLPPMAEVGSAAIPIAIRSGDRLPAERVYDATPRPGIQVEWQLPPGEPSGYAEIELDGERRRSAAARWSIDPWESPRAKGTAKITIDAAAPPPWRIVHPYLVSSSRNAAIDLKLPRRKLTLHLELGPLLQFAPSFDVGVVAPDAVWMQRVPADTPPELLQAAVPQIAVRRGGSFATAPPQAGAWRVLIDPLVAAPLEIRKVECDGGTCDLGSLRFVRGSTLTVRVRMPAGLSAPDFRAVARRVDGLPYARAATRRREPSTTAQDECAITGLGGGRFDVRLHSISGFEARCAPVEVTVDGVHDAEITIDAR